MEVEPLGAEGLVVLKPKIFTDARGHFFESFNAKRFFEATNEEFHSVQDNESLSRYGVLRGFHFQKPPYEQAKLVRAIEGEVLDVVVDIRKDSPTFGKAFSVVLSGTNKKQLFVPKGFAHAFLALSDNVTFFYKVDNYYNPKADSGLRFDDPDINFNWPISREQIITSVKDKRLPLLKDLIL